jgi:hypothetical protein
MKKLLVFAGLFALCVWYMWPEKQNSQVAPVSAPKVEPEKLTSKYIQRDEKTGEQFRCEKRDSAGVLRELEIGFADGTKGTRYYDATGVLHRIVRTTESGSTLSAKVGADSKFESFEETNKNGVVVSRYSRSRTNEYALPLFKQYRDDGTLRCEVVLEKGGRVWRTYHLDGKTVHAEADLNPLRNWAKIYRADGSLHFEEKLADPKARFGSIVNHIAIVYSSDGKPTERITSDEGPYSNWQMSIKDVAILNADGTVKSNGRPERDGTGYRAKLVNTVYQSFVEVIADAHKGSHEGVWGLQEKRGDLADVLND